MSDTKDIILQRRDDALDFNAEISGMDIGRVKRFLSAAAQEALLIAKGKKPDPSQMSLLDILLLTDPAYRRLYLQLDERLTSIEKAIDDSLIEINAHLDLFERRRQELQYNAYVDEDGKRIYRGINDEAYFEDGTMLDPRKVALIEWQDHHSFYHDYHANESNIALYMQHKQEITDYRDNTIHDVRERMYDGNPPMDKDDFEAATSKIEADMPDYVRLKLRNAHELSSDADNSLSSTFRKTITNTETDASASLDIPAEFAMPASPAPVTLATNSM